MKQFFTLYQLLVYCPCYHGASYVHQSVPISTVQYDKIKHFWMCIYIKRDRIRDNGTDIIFDTRLFHYQWYWTVRTNHNAYQ